jgi:tetratricopeptide (TPR) repeat protein
MKFFLAIFGILFLFIVLCDAQENLGKIDFPATGKAEARAPFLKGVLLLHSFEYPDALDAFEEAIRIDPDFVMAYWGAAMTHNHPIWMEQNLEEARKILQRLAPTAAERQKKATTDREKVWLQAIEVLYGDGSKEERDLKYEKAMENLSRAYPDDLEAAIFHALSILGTAHRGRDFRIYMKAAGILEDVYEKAPNHPGVVHYMIHCYDDPIHASIGLRPARKYAKIAPAAAHAQHMPSHIFLALGMWDDVVSSNEVAWKVSDERVQRKKLNSDERGYHYLHWLEYGYLQQGRFDDARKVLAIIQEDVQKQGTPRAIATLIRMRAAYILETERWNYEPVAHPVDLSKVKLTGTAIHLFTNGYVSLKNGDLTSARKILSDLQSQIKSTARQSSDTHHMAPSPQSYSLDQSTVEILAEELEAAILFGEGKKEEAIAKMKKIADRESSLTFEFGPPEIVKPSHELLGEMLLEMKKGDEARQHFQLALERAPGRVLAIKGLQQKETSDEQR